MGMRMKIKHVTSYHYEEPVSYALQQLRLTPKTRPGQKVISWTTSVEGGTLQVAFDDEHFNQVQLISFELDVQDVTISCEGEVEVEDLNGVFGEHSGFMPLWMFERSTELTRPGPLIRKLARDLAGEENELASMHALSERLQELVVYEPGLTSVSTPAEDVLAAGKGVCQDHAHVFISTARQMGLPARYVSGYLMMSDRVDQDATHAWAEVYLPGLGWVGFDVSNGVCPDARYVRVATGLDYADAAPVSGMRFGEGAERLAVQVQVQQQ